MKKNSIFSRLPGAVWFLFINGALLRWFYILATPINLRQHDMGGFDGSGSLFHSGYIEYIMNHGLLPDFDPRNAMEFAHPPLHHMISAWWMKLMTGVFGVEYEAAAESLQYLTMLYSILLMYVCYRIFRYLKLEGLPLYIATAITCFHPVFILLSGSANNDMLAILLMAAALLFALKWYRDGRWRDLIGSAITVGLAMMTKLSSVFVAAPIGFLLLIRLIRLIREHRLGHGIRQIGAYAAISLPIGMWFPIYNKIRWDMPLFFVYRLAEDNPQYVGDLSVWKRLFDFSPSQFFNIYEQWYANPETGVASYNEFNPITVALKNSMFGEFVKENTFDSMPVMDAFCGILFFSGAILAIGAFVYMIRNLIRDRGAMYIERLALGLFFLVMMVGYYVAAFEYPFVCTMDFRYIPLTVLVGACFIGLGTKRVLRYTYERTWNVRSGLFYGVFFTTAAFCFSSLMMYIGLIAVTNR